MVRIEPLRATTRSVSVSGVARKLPVKRYTTKSPGARSVAVAAAGSASMPTAGVGTPAFAAGRRVKVVEARAGARAPRLSAAWPQPRARIEAVARVNRVRVMPSRYRKSIDWAHFPARPRSERERAPVRHPQDG